MKIKKLCAVLLCASALLQGAANAQAMGLASWINRYGELTDTAVDAQNKLWILKNGLILKRTITA